MESWSENIIWWHLYPLGFLGAEKNRLPAEANSIPRLRNLEPWLQYQLELGCNGLILAPIFISGTHGYDTVNHFKIDPRLGNEDDMQWLLDTCQRLGIRLVLDGVFNHVGRGFEQFEDVRYHRQNSRYASWFRIDWNNTHNEDGFGYQNFEGHNQLVALNHDNPEVAQYVFDVMNHWLRRGVSGWRLDAAYSVAQHFWKNVLPRVHAEHPEAWFLGEVIHGDYAGIARQTSMNSITQYELWKAIWSALNDRNYFELSHALNRHNQYLDAFVPNIFLGNHDVTRIATQLNDARLRDLAMVLLLTLPGIPSIYAGDEQAFTGRKEHRVGGDEEIRSAFPSDPSVLAPDGWATFAKYQAMVRFRKSNSWITSARTNVLTLQNKFLLYEVRNGDQQAFVALNCGDTACSVADGRINNQRVVFGKPLDNFVVGPYSAVIWCNG